MYVPYAFGQAVEKCAKPDIAGSAQEYVGATPYERTKTDQGIVTAIAAGS
jgi:hypothetical protein